LNNVYDEITNKAVSSLAELTKSPLDEAVCAMYALELDLPHISRSMIEDLNKFFSLLNSNSTTILKFMGMKMPGNAAILLCILAR
jgi:pyrroloquinoline quinone (PQQ) biosynthesis protein C